MARAQAQVAMVIAHKRYKAGTIYADSAAVAQAGDVIWTGLNSMSWSHGLVPLDAGAVALKNASRFATTPVPSIDGTNSIEA